jgi:hypothetical protein
MDVLGQELWDTYPNSFENPNFSTTLRETE